MSILILIVTVIATVVTVCICCVMNLCVIIFGAFAHRNGCLNETVFHFMYDEILRLIAAYAL